MLQCALNYFDSVFFMPLCTCFLMTSGVLSGVFFFGEADGMAPLNVAMFSAGLLLSICGTLLLTKRTQVNSGRLTPRLERYLTSLHACWNGCIDGVCCCCASDSARRRCIDGTRRGGGGGESKNGADYDVLPGKFFESKNGADADDDSGAGAPLMERDVLPGKFF